MGEVKFVVPVRMRGPLASVPMHVDEFEARILGNHKWHLDSHGYPQTKVKTKMILAHHIVMWKPKGKEIDHVNHDRLDNRKKNLRVVSHSQNRMNVGKYKNNKTGFRGVYFHKARGKYAASIQANNMKKHLGLFKTAEEASKAYNESAKQYHGVYSFQN